MEGFEYMAKKLKHDFVGSGKLLTDVGLGKKMIRAVSSEDYSGKKKKKVGWLLVQKKGDLNFQLHGLKNQ